MTIYLIRHAQSEFNAVFDQDKPDPMIFDAPITELGSSQAMEAGEKIQHLELARIIVSPFTRTLQTADLIFGNKMAMEVNATVREQLSNSCDVGRTPDQLANDFPHHDFTNLQQCWWHDEEKDHRGISVEPDHVLQQRVAEFVSYLKRIRAHSTAIVTHGNFIRALTGNQIDNCQIIEFNLATA